MRALLLRDLRLAFRAGGGFGLGLAFFLIVTVLVPFPPWAPSSSRAFSAAVFPSLSRHFSGAFTASF